jgi:hypothetical protein
MSTSAGVTVLGSPPPSVQFNQLESNTDIFAFQERAGYTLPVPVLVDVTDPGTYDQVSDVPLIPSTIPAGTTVNSYLLHADPDLRLVSTDFVVYSNRSVTFDANEVVIGIQLRTDTLLLMHPVLGAPGTAYPPPSVTFGLELTDLIILPGDDSLTLSADRRTVTVNLITGSGADTGGMDQVRILTQTLAQPIPEPSTFAFMAAGAVAFIAARRRRCR